MMMMRTLLTDMTTAIAVGVVIPLVAVGVMMPLAAMVVGTLMPLVVVVVVKVVVVVVMAIHGDHSSNDVKIVDLIFD